MTSEALVANMQRQADVLFYKTNEAIKSDRVIKRARQELSDPKVSY